MTTSRGVIVTMLVALVGVVGCAGEEPAASTAARPIAVPVQQPLAEDAPATLMPEPDPVPAMPAVPTRLDLPSLGVTAPVVPVGLNPDRSMEIPHLVSTVGWYEPGVRPGEVGSAVLAGHVDSRDQGRGAFFRLRDLATDDVVALTHEDGAVTEWVVVEVRSYPKDELPISELFTRFGDTRLALITCGGPFERASGRYTENIVVYAAPA